MITLEQLESLKDRESRHLYVSDRIRELLAAQIREMREENAWSQAELGGKAGMAQERVSLLEDPDYSGLTLKTLKRLGEAFDVALLVEYVSFRELLERTQAREKLTVPSYDTDLAELGTTAHIISATAGTFTLATFPDIDDSVGGILRSDWVDQQDLLSSYRNYLHSIGDQYSHQRNMQQFQIETPVGPSYALAS